MERGHQNRYPRRNPSSSNSSSSSSLPKSSSFTANRSRNTNGSRFDHSTITNSAPNNPNNQRDLPRRRSSITNKTRGGDEEQVTEDESSTFPILVGTCQFMCPEGERTQRERLRDLAVFERLHGNPGKTSPSLAVKKFCRTISTAQSSDVRPLPVLDDTLSYLLSLVDTTDHPFEVVHDFVFDRTRSVRQDLSIQNIVNDKAIHMYEKMVKFHILSHHKLRGRGSNADSSSAHYLNMEQLIKALTSLYNLYNANRDSNSIYENEAEFQSLYVLLHLDYKRQPTGESLSLWFRRAPRTIIRSKQMCFARRVLQCFRMGNYKRFFDIIAAEASFLQYCIIEPYINEEPDLEILCNACGLETSTDETGNKLLATKQTTFCIPKAGFQSSNFPGIDQFESIDSV
ncbi:SAC3 family protein C isoform X2 [Euphorbia lathyris]|uniref:SAC3 family protein C isoform X2 n=1 Tax=Euphorbia lathyris TaxID=212925 RepID=UPI00331317A3